MDEVEIWKDIPGYAGEYQASSLGRIRSLRFRNRFTNRPRGKPLILKPSISRAYFIVDLRGKTKTVHRLVMAAFKGRRPAGLQTAHLDGNPKNNKASNLAWVTCRENISHKNIHGTALIGEKSQNAKLTTAQVFEIKKLLKAGTQQQIEIAKAYGVSTSLIYRIRAGKAWRHLGKEQV